MVVILQTYKELIKREQALREQLAEIESELDDLSIVIKYFKTHFMDKEAQNLFENYLVHIEAYCNWQKVLINEESHDPDEALMRKIENSIGISENAKKAFREEILIRASSYTRKGKKFDYTSHDSLREAIEKVILQ
ncbi:hypothetical protein GCM10023310_68990 [Paenibacillus vulneris]